MSAIPASHAIGVRPACLPAPEADGAYYVRRLGPRHIPLAEKGIGNTDPNFPPYWDWTTPESEVLLVERIDGRFEEAGSDEGFEWDDPWSAIVEILGFMARPA